MMNWYTAKVVTGKEKKTIDIIWNQLISYSLDGLVADIIAPAKKQLFMKKGKKVEREVVILTGYIFFKSEDNAEVFRTINKSPNVIGITENTNKIPAKIPQLEMDRLFNLSKKSYDDLIFLEGETIQVIDGPFKGFSGNIIKSDTTKKKAQVGVMVFGRETKLELSYQQIDKLKDAAVS